MEHRIIRRIVLLVLLAAPGAVGAADILQEVPNDALGVVLVHRLADFDTKAKWLSLELRNSTFSPLAFLKAVTNVQEGLNPEGDFLLAVYPDPRAEKTRLRFGIWLPVLDYARFGKSIGASSLEGISTVTIAGEDLLVARRGDWALVMDMDQRERMTQLVAAASSPPVSPQIAGWKNWIEGNDVTIIAYAAGVRELLSLIDDSDNEEQGDDEGEGDLFGEEPARVNRRMLATVGTHRRPTGFARTLLEEYRKWTEASPAIAHTIEQADMVGCGLQLRLDQKEGNSARVGLRVAFNDGFEAEKADVQSGLPDSIYDKGGFSLAGSGRLPKSVTETIARGYMQTIVEDMKKEERTELDADSLQQLNEAVGQAAGEVRSAMVVTQPGDKLPPVYTNNFAVVRVDSAQDFVGRIGEVMRLWNKANHEADGDTKLIFALEKTKVGERAAQQYAIDFATMLGTPAVPEIRQSMEKLFGPGGKLRLWVVPTDDHTVLLGQGTQDQVAATLKLLDGKQPIDWNRTETQLVNRLLPAESDWRLFFDPHRYFDWERRQAMAVTGVSVIGGPLVRAFRESPPVGILGGFREQELWIDVVALAPTIKSAYEFLTPMKPRPKIQLKADGAAR